MMGIVVVVIVGLTAVASMASFARLADMASFASVANFAKHSAADAQVNVGKLHASLYFEAALGSAYLLNIF